MTAKDSLLNFNTVQQFEEFYKSGDHMCPNEHIVRLIKGFFGKNAKDARLLDYGFGPGENLLHFLRVGYICSGLEVAHNAQVLVEKKLLNYPQYQGRIDLKIIGREDGRIPWDDNTFDYIVSNQVLYHLLSEEKITAALNEFKRVLKPGGKIIVSMLGEDCLFRVFGKEVSPNIYRYDYKENKMNEYMPIDEKIERLYFILRNETHARQLFSMFNIHEVGWWKEVYLGNTNHHYVILASK